MRKWVAVTLAGVSAAATLGLGVGPASAATKYTCTKMVNGHTVTVHVARNRVEDRLEHHGFTCTGDMH
jgi:uncharacterized protein (DUF1786 family)